MLGMPWSLSIPTICAMARGMPPTRIWRFEPSVTTTAPSSPGAQRRRAARMSICSQGEPNASKSNTLNAWRSRQRRTRRLSATNRGGSILGSQGRPSQPTQLAAFAHTPRYIAAPPTPPPQNASKTCACATSASTFSRSSSFAASANGLFSTFATRAAPALNQSFDFPALSIGRLRLPELAAHDAPHVPIADPELRAEVALRDVPVPVPPADLRHVCGVQFRRPDSHTTGATVRRYPILVRPAPLRRLIVFVLLPGRREQMVPSDAAGRVARVGRLLVGRELPAQLQLEREAVRAHGTARACLERAVSLAVATSRP